MRFSTTTITTAIAAATLAQAQTATDGFAWITNLNASTAVRAGQAYDLAWTSRAELAGGTMTFHLVRGPDANSLSEWEIVKYAVPNSETGTLTWVVDENLADGPEGEVFGFNITLDCKPNEVFQYSNHFSITK
ncbi:hypothetical protein F4778DRAFT_522625 [Xylariomycetidae sp. FL2044]|nr:hypothetical protein F4778DRAFT_522625 [Xylariomycetidae sp. FL2044]